MRYTSPIEIVPGKDSCILKAIVVRGNMKTRTLVRPFQFSKSSGHLATLKNAPNEKYTYNGATILTDGIRGDFNYSNGCWLGFKDTPLDATIDMGEPQQISSVKVGTLVQYSEYIFPPTKITVYAAEGNNEMQEVGKLDIPITKVQDKDGLREYSCDFSPIQASKIRIVIETTSQIPAWHGAKGEKAWLFVDEISVD